MGRTGTFITLHSQMKRLHEENSIDVFGFVKGMRRQRCLMVQTEVICPNELLLKVIYYIPFQRQYVFIHDALLEAIECGDTDVSARDLNEQYRLLCALDDTMQKTMLQMEFEVCAFGPT